MALTQYRASGSFLPLTQVAPVPVQLQSLELWRHALVESVRGDAPDLSARQMALMLVVYLGDGPHTVRGLSQALKISKPAISRALDRLGEFGYVRRERDDLDRRNVLVQRTSNGAKFLTEFSQLIDMAKDYATAIPARMVEFTIEQAAPRPAWDAPRQQWAIEAAE
jgi:DNA-binding MarR family transcriptional regulator